MLKIKVMAAKNSAFYILYYTIILNCNNIQNITVITIFCLYKKKTHI